MELQEIMLEKAKAAKNASYKLNTLSTQVKNKALLAMADILEHRKSVILEANAQDLEDAKKRDLLEVCLIPRRYPWPCPFVSLRPPGSKSSSVAVSWGHS